MIVLSRFPSLAGAVLAAGALITSSVAQSQDLPQSVLIEVDQVYEYRRPSLIGYIELEDYELPVLEYVEDMMFAADIEPLYRGDEGGEAIIRITVRGRANGGTYLEPTKAYLYTGADLTGEIEITGPGDTLVTATFSSTIQRPFQLTINLGYEDPSNAPFGTALAQPGGFIEELCYILGVAWGAEAILPSLFEHEPAIRAGAATALGNLGDPVAVPDLLDALYDKESRVRWESAWSLGRIGDVRAVPELIDALRDESPDVRWFSSWSLRALTGEDFGLDHDLWSAWLSEQPDVQG
jgi:hypothetical protein